MSHGKFLGCFFRKREIVFDFENCVYKRNIAQQLQFKNLETKAKKGNAFPIWKW